MAPGLRIVAPGRFRVSLRLPWGQRVPAELILSTRGGWAGRPEARDSRWAAFPLGPATLALRLLGDPPAPSRDRAPALPEEAPAH